MPKAFITNKVLSLGILITPAPREPLEIELSIIVIIILLRHIPRKNILSAKSVADKFLSQHKKNRCWLKNKKKMKQTAEI